ncbi:hypothetical protein V1358_07520 [Pseudoalteromonas sp. YIC-656]|uniref:hypothetical protein n=1 Tax=Pseudoalteromonas pernae TaxID=3118054 RepID=UPI003242AD55
MSTVFNPIEMFHLYESGVLAKILANFINWGIMMALLVNIVKYSDPKNRSNSALWLSLIICLSYASTSFIGRELSKYLIWMAADLITVLVLVIVQLKRPNIAAFYYCVLVLVANALLHLAIFIDAAVLKNYDPWWLWNVYSVGVNINDLVMIIALTVNRDFLGLCRVGRYMRDQFDATLKAA